TSISPVIFSPSQSFFTAARIVFSSSNSRAKENITQITRPSSPVGGAEPRLIDRKAQRPNVSGSTVDGLGLVGSFVDAFHQGAAHDHTVRQFRHGRRMLGPGDTEPNGQRKG